MQHVLRWCDCGARGAAFGRAQVRVVIAQCDYVLTALDGGVVGLAVQTAALLRQRWEDARDRLDELEDSLGWSAEAAEELRGRPPPEAHSTGALQNSLILLTNFP